MINRLVAMPFMISLVDRFGKHSSIHPLEGLLRPPVEFYAAVSYLILAVLIGFMPEWFMLSSIISKFLATLLFALGLRRALQGFRVLVYQHHLVVLPEYKLSSSELIQQQTRLATQQFIGRGFKWTAQHTQRYRELSDPDNKKFLNSNTERAEGGDPALHGIELQEENVFINQSERVAHVLYMGTTRVGKTRALETNIIQDIARGDCVIIIDPKGDQQLLRRVLFEAQRTDRLDDVIAFHLGFPEQSARYNPIAHFERITEVANRVANQLPSSGDSAAFREFAWRFTNVIVQAIVALGRTPTYLDIKKNITQVDELLWDYAVLILNKTNALWEIEVNAIKERLQERDIPRNLMGKQKSHIALVKYIQDNQLADDIMEGLISTFAYDKTYYDKITASLLPLLEKLTSGKIVELISSTNKNDYRPEFDWNTVIEHKKIVYVGLDALSDRTVAEAVGNSMFADLVSTAGKRYKENNISNNVCIHADEFNELIGDEFIPLLNKAGGAKFMVTVYTQTWTDVAAKLNNRDKAGQIAGNLNTIICLRVLERSTAEMITDRLPKVAILSTTSVSSANDTGEFGSIEGDFRSSNEDKINQQEVPLITPDCLMQLPKGQAFAIINGSQVFKVRLPLPNDDMTTSFGISEESLLDRHESGEKLLRLANQLNEEVAA